MPIHSSSKINHQYAHKVHTDTFPRKMPIKHGTIDGLSKPLIVIPPEECKPVWRLGKPSMRKAKRLSSQIGYLCMVALAGLVMSVLWTIVSKPNLFHIPGMDVGDFASVLTLSHRFSVRESTGVNVPVLKINQLEIKTKNAAHTDESIPIVKTAFKKPFGEHPKVSVPETYLKNTETLLIQVGCFRKKSNAENLLIRLKNDGYDTYLEPSIFKTGQILYRVRLKGYENMSEARKTREQLASHGIESYIIRHRREKVGEF